MKQHAPLVAACVFIVVGGILFLATMNDEPAPPQPKKSSFRPSGFTAEKLKDSQSPTAQLYIKTCIQCHELPDPQSHTPEEWPDIVHRMVDRLRRRRFFSAKSLYVPGAKATDQIIAFLQHDIADEKEIPPINPTP